MLDERMLVSNTEQVAARLGARGVDRETVIETARLCRTARDAEAEVERHNRLRKERGKRPAPAENGASVNHLRDLKRQAVAARAEAVASRERADEAMASLPNLPHTDTPSGLTADANVVRRERRVDGPTDSVPHWELALDLGISAPARASSMSGPGFTVLRGTGARLLRSLVAWGLDVHSDGYEELVVPQMVTTATMVGSGHLPRFRDGALATADAPWWLVPTAEVPLAALHTGERLDAEGLPASYMAHVVCFRKEIGQAGAQTRGMQRLHEYHQLEAFVYCRPEQVDIELDRMLAAAERTVELLHLPYRVVELCAGELPLVASRCYRLEVRMVGMGEWLAVGAVSDNSEFQARRHRIRIASPKGSVYARTLNGSLVGVSRLWAAVLEHGRQSDGSVSIPEVLRPYVGADVIGPPASDGPRGWR